MTTDDSEQFASRLAGLAEVFDVKLSAMRQAIYFEALRDIDLDLVADAINRAVRECRFFPKPVELIELAVGSPSERAEEAWSTFRHLAKKNGANNCPDWIAPSLSRTLVSVFGSWYSACLAELTPYVHRQFLETFQRHDGPFIRSEYGELPAATEPKRITGETS